MCGIYGQIADLPESTLINNAHRAIQVLSHRGPDGKGIAHGHGYCLGHRRLAIFDTSALGAQPMTAWGHTVVFNGAIYNWEELRRELETGGYSFRSRTDTELVLAAYDKWGTGCFRRFNGMWAMAIVTPAEAKVVLSRDRFGIKPLYYSLSGGLTFASEPGVVATHANHQAAVNRQVAAEFIRYGWQDHRPESLYTDVLQLAPGHYATASLQETNTLQLTSFYDLDGATALASVGNTRNEAELRLRELLNDSVRLRSRSDVGRCITLSGGIDSSSIAGILATHAQIRPLTFSALFPGDPLDESPYVEAVCEHHHLRNLALTPTYEEVMNEYAATQFAQGQPIASLAVVAHYQLMRAIHASGERVLLNGQGADEIGAGYDKFYLPYFREAIRRRPWSGVKNLARYFTQQPIDVGKTFSRLAKLAAQSLERENPVTGPYFDGAETAAFKRGRDVDVRTTSINLIREVGLPVLLRHEDRNTMAFGIESRAPFMDHRVVEHLLAMPDEWKIHRAVRKNAIREACRDVLPTKVYNRYKKLGFPTPATTWMEGDAGRYLDRIREGCRLGYFSSTLSNHCAWIMRKKQRNQYDLVFRCFSWVEFMKSA